MGQAGACHKELQVLNWSVLKGACKQPGQVRQVKSPKLEACKTTAEMQPLL